MIFPVPLMVEGFDRRSNPNGPYSPKGKNGRRVPTAILACIHVDGPGGRLIFARITKYVTSTTSQRSSESHVHCMPSKGAKIERS